MAPAFQTILQLIRQSAIPDTDKALVEQAVKEAEKAFEIVQFKLDRTEKVKRTTAILLEETIQELEQKRKAVEESKDALERSLEELKAAQQQLIQSEKMASLGELTAGIAHEIQNPLNFVNNFSEVSKELLDEMKTELDLGNFADARDIAADVIQNLEKILHHGKRADGIVKGMLQHSRTSSGQKESTDLNALCDEYLRLAYHGLRAKDKSFNATFNLDLDPAVGMIDVVPQDIGRVILNLINNAFYACSERLAQSKAGSQEPGAQSKAGSQEPIAPSNADKDGNAVDERAGLTANSYQLTASSYVPTVSLTTKKSGNTIEIKVADNGNGIPQKILDKIFQPFFTTKPTGQGTGLGLSLSYDIVKSHGGDLKVNTKEGEGSEFIIQVPVI